MGALRLLALALALVVSGPARAGSLAEWRPFVAEASLRFGVPIPWIEAVMRVESAGRTTLGGRPIVSPAGAMGLMQVMPATWRVMRERLRLGADPFDPHDNIIAGTGYLRLMYDRFGYPGLFAAYNAGPGRYAAYRLGSQALPGETSVYLASVTEVAAPSRVSAIAHARPALFVVLHAASIATPSFDHPAGQGPLFAISPNR